MLDIATSSVKLGGANPGSVRVLRSGERRIHTARPPSSQLRPRPQRNARRTHTGRRTNPPNWNRRPALGYDACVSTMHLPYQSRKQILGGSDVARTPGRRGRIRPGAMGSTHPTSLYRKPPRLPELKVQPSFPNHPALAVRSRVHQADVPMATRSTTTDGHGHPLRTRQLDGSKLPQVEAAITPAKSHFPRHRGRNGYPVVTTLA